MTSPRPLLESCVAKSAMPQALVSVLVEECPWLNGKDTVSERLTPELLADAFGKLSLGLDEIDRFIRAYNDEVDALLYPSKAVQDTAYGACLKALAPFGKDSSDSRDQADYEVFDESLCGPTISVTVFGTYRFSDEALAALRVVITKFGDDYNEIEVVDEDGNEIARLLPGER